MWLFLKQLFLQNNGQIFVTLQKFSCECEHNTCGESCDQCCPGYHQQPWMAGTYITRHVCESKRRSITYHKLLLVLPPCVVIKADMNMTQTQLEDLNTYL